VRTLKAKSGAAQTPAMLASVADHVWSLAECIKRPAVQPVGAVRQKAIPDSYPRFLAMSLLGGALPGEGKCSAPRPSRWWSRAPRR
jgi:hypothetical protein